MGKAGGRVKTNFWTKLKMAENDNFWTRPWVVVEEEEAKVARRHRTSARCSDITNTVVGILGETVLVVRISCFIEYTVAPPDKWWF